MHSNLTHLHNLFICIKRRWKTQNSFEAPHNAKLLYLCFLTIIVLFSCWEFQKSFKKQHFSVTDTLETKLLLLIKC